MKAAQIALEENSRGQAVLLLGKYLPTAGEEDLRGVEWRYLWQQLRGDEVTSWPGLGMATWIRYVPDGTRFLTAGVERKLFVHDAKTGKVLHTLPFSVNPANFNAVPALSPDGRLLAFYYLDDLFVYDAKAWILTKRIPIPEAAGSPPIVTRSTAFSPDGRMLAMTVPGGVRIWDITFGEFFQECA